MRPVPSATVPGDDGGIAANATVDGHDGHAVAVDGNSTGVSSKVDTGAVSLESVRDWVSRYRERGLAVVRVQPGEKRPTDPGWNLRSLEPDDFRECDLVGIQGGRLSGDVVCVDLDGPKALQMADLFLLPTAMVSGRPGKPRSHRFYRVKDVPPELTAGPRVSGGMGGPRIRHFKEAGIDIRGTGGQTVEPPTLHPSGECRIWHEFGTPAEVDCRELYESVERLAVACGGATKKPGAAAPKAKGRGHTQKAASGGRRYHPGLPDDNVRARRARTYVQTVDPAVSGDHGHDKMFYVACLLVRGFALPPEAALPLAREYSEGCQPPWSEGELLHKIQDADNFLDGLRGDKLSGRARPDGAGRRGREAHRPAPPGPQLPGA